MMFLAALFLMVGTALAQTKVNGTVTSQDDGQPVIGASVLVVGTQVGTVTDVNGRFELTVPAGKKTLRITYVGMEPIEVSARPNMRIMLTSDQKALDEVIVVAYGTQKRSAFTGSAAVVGSDEIAKVQVTNAADALKGKAAGVQIYNATGQPGSVPTIRVRGVNSLSADNAPLIVLDGSPYGGSLNDINPIDIESMTVLKDAASTALYGARGGNGVILITTKSAKKGRDAVITVDAKWGSNSKGTPDYERITDAAGYYETYYTALNNYALNGLGYNANDAWNWANNNLISNANGFGLGYNTFTIPEGQQMIGINGKLNPNATVGRFVTNNGKTYWIQPENYGDEIYHNSLRQEYTVSATGSTDRSTYYASVNYLNTEGITTGSDYERFTARLNASYQLKKWAKLSGNMAYSHFVRNYLSNEGDPSSGNVFALKNIAPIYPVFLRDENKNIIFDENAGINAYDYGDGSYLGFTRAYLSQSNPLSDMLVDTQENEGNTFNGTGQLDIYLPYGFTFTSINNVYLREYRYTNVTNPYFGQYASSNGIVTKEHGRTWTTNFQQRLNWRHLFGKHDVEAMIAHEYYRARDYELDYYKTNMFTQTNKELNGAVVAGTGGSYINDYNTESWLGRAMYNYDERYFVSASFVRQASSRFHKDHRWGSFWSFGGGWLINKEKFMAKTSGWLDELKLKVSYGENGNDGIGDFLYTNRYSITNSNNAVSLVPSTTKGNEEITWEKNAKFNIGFDFSFFKGRLNGSIEYYSNSTKDMLTTFPYPASLGFTAAYANVGNMKNNGIEIDLHGDIIRTKDFTWSAYVNLTSNHNEITKLADERKTQEVNGHWGYSSGNYFYTEGESRYTYYTYKYAGVYNENTWELTKASDTDVYNPANNGRAMYFKDVYKTDADGNIQKDENGNKIIEKTIATFSTSDATQYLCGDVLPDAYGGFGTSLQWKGFDFSVDFQYQLGGQVFDSEYQSLMSIDRGYGMHVDILNAWSPTNVNSNIPHLQVSDSYVASTSDRFLTSASYLTLSNITLGYTLPKSWTQKLGINRLRLYVVGDNLYTWTKRKGLDPRQSITGSSNGKYYSSVRSISGGVTIEL